jgi:aminopeptidase N
MRNVSVVWCPQRAMSPDTSRSMRSMRWLLVLLGCACSSRDPQPREPMKPPIARPDAGTDVVPGLRLPAGATPLAYDVRLELDPERETFAGRVVIRTKLDAPTQKIWLHADELELAGAQVTAGGKTLAATIGPATEHEQHPISVGEPIAGEVTIEITYTGRVRDDVEGLFRQKFGTRWFLYSQAEATYARRIVPCFDEPKFKVPWRVTLVVPEGQVALANAPALRERIVDKRREITFAEMPNLPAHLFAIAVGPFTLVELGKVGKGGVPVRVAVAPRDAKRLGAMGTWVPKLVDALEQYFDQPLPLAKLDLVAVPRFFGAMENPGLITFEVTALVGNDKDPSFLRRHIRFLAHELAHQWVGNAVTPAWWDDLWLAEAFATWLDDKLSNALGALDDPALRTQLARAKALAADRQAGAKPLRRTAILTNEDIEDAFDAISYEKGAAVITMFERFIGEPTFQGVMRDYMKRSSATAQDFLSALGRVDPQIAKAFAGYLDRAGAPIVDVTLDCTTAPKLTATPRDGAAVPVCIRHPGGTVCKLATGATQLAVGTTCPAWVVGNASGRGYYQVHTVITPGPLTPAERLAYGDDRAAAVSRGEVTHTEALASIDTLLAARDPYAELAALGIAVELDRLIAEPALASWSSELARRFAKRLTPAAVWSPRSPIDFAIQEVITELVPPDQFPRATAQKSRALVDRALAAGAMTIRSTDLVYAISLAAPTGAKQLFDAIIAAAAKNTAFSDEWFEGLGYFDATFAPRAVDLVFDKRFEPDRSLAVVGTMLGRTPTRAAAWRAVHARVGELLATLGATDGAALIEATAHLCDPAQRTQVEADFTPHLTAIEGGKRALDQALASIDRCIAAATPAAAARP